MGDGMSAWLASPSRSGRDIYSSPDRGNQKSYTTLNYSPSRKHALPMDSNAPKRRTSAVKSRTNLLPQGSRHVISSQHNMDTRLGLNSGGANYQNVQNPLSRTRLVLSKTKGRLPTSPSAQMHVRYQDCPTKISQCGIFNKQKGSHSHVDATLSSAEPEIIQKISIAGSVDPELESEIEYLQNVTSPFACLPRSGSSSSEACNKLSDRSIGSCPSSEKSKVSSHEFIHFVGQKQIHSPERPSTAKSQTSGYQTLADSQRDDAISVLSESVDFNRSDVVPIRQQYDTPEEKKSKPERTTRPTVAKDSKKENDKVRKKETSVPTGGFLGTDITLPNRNYDYDFKWEKPPSLPTEPMIDILVQPPRPSTQTLFQRVHNMNKITDTMRGEKAVRQGDTETAILEDLTTDTPSSRSVDISDSSPVASVKDLSSVSKDKVDNMNPNFVSALTKFRTVSKKEQAPPPRPHRPVKTEQSPPESPILPVPSEPGNLCPRHSGISEAHSQGLFEQESIEKPGGCYQLYQPMELGKAYKEDFKNMQNRREQPRTKLDISPQNVVTSSRANVGKDGEKEVFHDIASGNYLFTMGQSAQRKSWLTGRLSTSKDCCRFELPMDLRQLEEMSPMDYLTQYAVVNRRRRMLYKVIFVKYDKDRDGQLTKQELSKAIKDLHATLINNQELASLEEILGIEEQQRFTLHEFNSVAAFSERFVQLPTERKATLRKQLIKKDTIEKADFSGLKYKLSGVTVSPAMRKVLQVL